MLAQRWPALVREAAGFVCVSAAVAEIAAARGVPAGKLTVLPIGVEIPDQQPPAHQPTAHLFAGRFVEKKGILVLADAVRRLRAQGDPTPLVCVGDGTLRPLLEALARETPGVTLTGWLPPEAVRARMQESVSLLVPSIVASDGDAEGLPSVIPEAMAQGCPVIGSDLGGIAEAIRHDQTGLLVAPGDAAALARAMSRLTREPGLRTRSALERLHLRGGSAQRPDPIGEAGGATAGGLASGRLALPALHARVLLVDHVDASAAAHHAAVLIANLGGTQAVTDFMIRDL